MTKLALPAVLLAPVAALSLTGCSSMSLPEGYSWNITPHEQNDINPPRAAYRHGFDQSRINESLPTTSRDRTRYDYASVLPSARASAPVPVASDAYASADPLYTALDPLPAPTSNTGLTPAELGLGTGDDTPVVFSMPPEPVATPVARGAFRAPATTEVRILGGAAEATPVGEASGSRTHTVAKGDNYWDLAVQYYGRGIRFKDIEAANPGKDPKKLQIGDTLVIPE